jgi:UDP-2,3-diacylglucosamine pyrophosphatase LpxH
MVVGLVAAMDRLRHRAAYRGYLPAVGGVFVKLRTDDECIAALDRHKGSHTKAAADLGIDRRSLDRRIPALVRKGYSPAHGYVHPVPDGYAVKGVSTYYDKDGNPAGQWVKSTADDERRKAIIEASFTAMIGELKPLPARKENRKNYRDDLLAAYPWGDPHVGMRAWAKECGADWDLAIAQNVHRIVVDDLVSRSQPAEQALLVNLGDLLHYDSMMPVTSRSGNMLDADGRYNKMIRVATDVMTQFVESALTRHKLVHVISAIGNHDETGAQWMALLLEQKYANNKRVSVDTSPSVFNYYRWEQNFIGVHHGHTVKKIDALPAIMATDRPKDWGECANRAWWTGHVHHEAVKEFPGCMVETFGTLATPDAYAAAGGWRSRQNAYAIELHATGGEVDRHRSNPVIAGVNLAPLRIAA